MNGLNRQVMAISSTHWIKRWTELLASERRFIPSCCQQKPPKPVARRPKITGCQHVKDFILQNIFFCCKKLSWKRGYSQYSNLRAIGPKVFRPFILFLDTCVFLFLIQKVEKALKSVEITLLSDSCINVSL